MKYRVKSIDGLVWEVSSLREAASVYCTGRPCSACRLSHKNQRSDTVADACSEIDDDELLRRFGSEIEIIHDDDETAAPEQEEPKKTGLTVYRLTEILQQLIDAGYRDLPIFIDGAGSCVDGYQVFLDDGRPREVCLIFKEA